MRFGAEVSALLIPESWLEHAHLELGAAEVARRPRRSALLAAERRRRHAGAPVEAAGDTARALPGVAVSGGGGRREAE